MPGSGKSYAALAISEKTDPTFTIDRVCFSLEEFLVQLRSGLPKGAALILDEAAISANARNWFSIQNKLLNYIFVTFRSSNLTTFLCLPHSTMLDSQARKLLHFSIEPVTINKAEGYSRLKILSLQSAPWHTNIYQHHKKAYGSVDGSDVRRVRVTRVRCPLPSLALRKAYELKKQKFRDELEASIQAELTQSKERADNNKSKDYSSQVEEIIANPQPYEKTYSGRTFLDLQLIKDHFKVGSGTGRRIKAKAEQKLYGSALVT